MLEQNYPNPIQIFGPLATATMITYSLPHESVVIMTIHNVPGKTVKTFDEGVQEGGVHSFTWDALGLHAATYLYKLTVSDKKGLSTQVRKAPLLR